MYYWTRTSPLGTLSIVASTADSGAASIVASGPTLWAVTFEGSWERERELLCARVPDARLVPGRVAAIDDVLARYFDGELGAIDTLAVDTGGTEFQRAVWTALRDIPAGTTISYGELARRIGRPSAVRAVGAANGANPVPIVVPCHRVINASGKLHGYGGGLERKAWLLRHEGVGTGQLALPV